MKPTNERRKSFKLMRAALFSTDEPTGQQQQQQLATTSEQEVTQHNNKTTNEVILRQWFKICRKSSR